MGYFISIIGVLHFYAYNFKCCKYPTKRSPVYTQEQTLKLIQPENK